MKIATFNINNINKRLSNLLAWLKAVEPDVVSLQELKAADGDFPKDAIETAGYSAGGYVLRTGRGYSHQDKILAGLSVRAVQTPACLCCRSSAPP